MPSIEFLHSQSTSNGRRQSMMTATAHSNSDEFSQRVSSLESVKRSIDSSHSNSDEFSQKVDSLERSMDLLPPEDNSYNDIQSISSMDALYKKRSSEDSFIMDKRLVVVLVTAGSLALFFMLIVGAMLPDDGEFGAKGGVTITSSNDKENNIYRTVPLPPEDIDRLCDDTFISSPHGYALCRQACKFSECCMLNSEVEGSCVFGDNRKVCALYQKSCDKVYQDDQDKKVNANANATTKQTTLHFDKTSLEDVCSDEHLSTDEGKIKCYDACKPAMCCFQPNTNSSSSCDGDNHDSSQTKNWCDMFSPCSKVSFSGHHNLRKRTHEVFNTTSELNSITSLSSNSTSFIDSPNRICNEPYISNSGYDKCKEICKKGYCCFHDNDTSAQCSSQNTASLLSLGCKVYEPCSIIYVNNSTKNHDSGN